MAKPSTGAKRLTQLKKDSGLSDEQIGRLVGLGNDAGCVSGVTVLKWRTGAGMPTYAYRVALQVLSTRLDGDGNPIAGTGIPLDVWDVSGEESRIMDACRPLRLALG